MEVDYNAWRRSANLPTKRAKVQKHINISPDTWKEVLLIAQELGCMEHGRPSVVQLLDGIAMSDLVVTRVEKGGGS